MTNPATEATLRLSQERCRTLIAAIGDIVWTTSASGQVIEDQPAWRAYTGQTGEEIQGGGWLAAVDPDSREAASAWASAAARGLPYTTEWRLRRRDGEHRWFSVHAAPVRAENGAVREWIGCNIDITEHKRRDEERMRLQAQTEATVARLERQWREMQILKNLSDTLQACNSREEAYPFIALAATELFPGATGALAVPAPGEREMIETAIQWGQDPLNQGGVTGQPAIKDAWVKPDFAIDDCWALRRGSMHEPGVGTLCQHFMTGVKAPHACVPLTVRGQVSGLLSIRLPQTHLLDDERRAALSAFGNAVALGLSTLQLRETLQEQSIPGR